MTDFRFRTPVNNGLSQTWLASGSSPHLDLLLLFPVVKLLGKR